MPTRKIRIGSLAILLLVGSATAAVACNIPVFRYALERWKPDSSQVVVFHSGPLSAQDARLIEQLEAGTGNGRANAELVRVDLGDVISETHSGLWHELKKGPGVELPYVLVRTQLGQSQFMNHWHGTLNNATKFGLYDSPVRAEVRDRLLAGHSVVWLLLGSSDLKLTDQLRKLTEDTIAKLPQQIQLPEGIGLPGSELYSEVPLVLKYSLLQIDPRDPDEAFLVNLLSGFRQQAYQNGEPLIVPVFGRGRALEVIPGNDVSARLIEDLAVYLSGACSCQVKEQNPGFDLLMNADWEGELFGDPLHAPPDRSAEEGQNRQPLILSIPPGRSR